MPKTVPTVKGDKAGSGQKTTIVSNDRLDSLWSDSTIPLTENPALDKLFVEYSRFKHLSDRLVLLNVKLNAVDYSSKKLGYGNTRAQAGLIGNLGDGKYVIILLSFKFQLIVF